MNLQEIPFEQLKLGDRHRKVYNEIEELAQSILVQGLLQPILVRADNLSVLAGGRRYKAIEYLREKGSFDGDVPCNVLHVDDPGDCLAIEAMENLQRNDFTWQESVSLVAKTHKAFADSSPNWTLEQTAIRLGMSKGQVSKDLKLAADMEFNPAIVMAETKSKASHMASVSMKRLESVASVAGMSKEDREKLAQVINCQAIKCGTAPTLEEIQFDGPQMETFKEEQDAEKGIKKVASEEASTSKGQTEEPFQVLPKITYRVCTFREILEELPSESVGLVECDPPYAIDFDQIYGKSQKLSSTLVDWDVQTFKTEMAFLLQESFRILTPNSWMLCWTAYEHVERLQKMASKTGFGIQRPGVWVKPGGQGNHLRKRLCSNMEFFLLFSKGDPVFQTPMMLQGIVNNTSSVSQKVHTTEKPLDLYDKMLSPLVKPGFLCFVPFAGSGNSLIAAAMKGMHAVGSDESDQYRKFFDGKVAKAFNIGG